ncbi:MAG: hypothetical protein NZ518_10410, partial [Dehalococcoidia bacterium]|nr:hypothetical protein [Dehalococcoidia bacterium]
MTLVEPRAVAGARAARPLRVVMLSKACYVAAYRTKLEELAARPGIADLTLVTPPYWRFGARRDPLEPGHDRGYRMI